MSVLSSLYNLNYLHYLNAFLIVLQQHKHLTVYALCSVCLCVKKCRPWWWLMTIIFYALKNSPLSDFVALVLDFLWLVWVQFVDLNSVSGRISTNCSFFLLCYWFYSLVEWTSCHVKFPACLALMWSHCIEKALLFQYCGLVVTFIETVWQDWQKINRILVVIRCDLNCVCFDLRISTTLIIMGGRISGPLASIVLNPGRPSGVLAHR